VDDPAFPFGLGWDCSVRPKKVDFYGLPRPVQERFTAATRRSAPPAPLLYARAPRTTAWASLAASAAATVLAILVLRVGWGNPESPLALHGWKMLSVDVLLFTASAYGVMHALGILRALDALPWRPGTYLFPGCVVEAEGPVLNVWAVGEAEAVEESAQPAGLVLRMRDGTRVVIPAANVDQRNRANAALGSLRDQLTRAIAEEDMHVLAELDPLHDSAFSSPIGPTEKMKRKLLVSAKFDWAIALAIGVVVGLALGETRNVMSDNAMFQAIGTSASPASYRLYLAHGSRYADQVRDVLLPRAELREAEAQGTVEAIEAFAQAHASLTSAPSPIQPEIDAALKRALLAQLQKAIRAGTVTALTEFASKYPQHLVDAEVKAARHALYVQALENWKKDAKVDPPTAAFMGRLLAWVEANGPATEVRFRLKPSQTMDDADSAVKKNARYPGADALPSKYMTPEAFRPREEKTAQALSQRFAAAFPPDVLLLKPGAPLDADAPVPASPPTLVVDYTTDWSRGATASAKPPTVFAGVIFVFDAAFALPPGAPVKASLHSWRGPELWKIKGAADMERTDFQQKVYDMMIDSAFDQLGKKLSDVFF
jgi:hypothetical protein